MLSSLHLSMLHSPLESCQCCFEILLCLLVLKRTLIYIQTFTFLSVAYHRQEYFFRDLHFVIEVVTRFFSFFHESYPPSPIMGF